MLTWAYAYLAVNKDWANGLHLLAAMVCDVTIVYYVAQIFIHAR